MRTPEFIERCMSAGMPLEMALKAAKAFEAECEIALEQLLDVRRSKERERQARHRAKKDAEANVVSRDETLDDVTQRDLTGALPQVVTPFSSSLRSEEVGVGGVGAQERVPPTDDWPKGGAQHHAKLLVEATASPWLDPNRSPDLVTTAGRIAAWKREGASWEHDVCAVVAGLMANRRSRVSSWKFFDQPVARSIADNRAALEIPEASRSPRGQGPPMSFAAQAAADAAEARRRVLES